MEFPRPDEGTDDDSAAQVEPRKETMERRENDVTSDGLIWCQTEGSGHTKRERMCGIRPKEIANVNSTCTPHEQEACLYMCTTSRAMWWYRKNQAARAKSGKRCEKESGGVGVIGRR